MTDEHPRLDLFLAVLSGLVVAAGLGVGVAHGDGRAADVFDGPSELIPTGFLLMLALTVLPTYLVSLVQVMQVDGVLPRPGEVCPYTIDDHGSILCVTEHAHYYLESAQSRLVAEIPTALFYAATGVLVASIRAARKERGEPGANGSRNARVG